MLQQVLHKVQLQIWVVLEHFDCFFPWADVREFYDHFPCLVFVDFDLILDFGYEVGDEVDDFFWEFGKDSFVFWHFVELVG